MNIRRFILLALAINLCFILISSLALGSDQSEQFRTTEIETLTLQKLHTIEVLPEITKKI